MAIQLPVAILADYANPLGSPWPWGAVVTLDDIAQALQERRLVSVPGTEDHAGRIAYLVENPASDPIAVDVGCPSLGYDGPDWPYIDGNHRLVAAIYRGDALIAADVDGEVGHATELFGVDCCDPDLPVHEGRRTVSPVPQA